MIELKNINKIYHASNSTIHALNNINLTVNKGEIFGVIGESGAGKSTLIRCVNLLERPTSGQVYVNNQELTGLTEQHLREARRHIGMIFQQFNLLNHRTVYQNIAFPLELDKRSTSQIDKIVVPLLELVGLQDKKDVYPAQLSGGQKQRVAIARALACNPKVLLCDEATSALDPQTTKTILQLLKDINIRFKLTILLITHEIEVVKEICDHVAMVDQGKIIEQNNLIAFFTKAKHPLIKRYISAALKQELPASLQKQLLLEKTENSNPVLRIIFHGQAAAEPFIAHLMQELEIKLNILQANIEFLKDDTLGIMVVVVLNNGEALAKGIAYLEDKSINVEIIGYVKQYAY